MTSEQHRIAFLVRRDGYSAAREWVARTRAIYAGAVDAGHGHAALPEYRPQFLNAIGEFDDWLSQSTAQRPRGRSHEPP